MVVDECRQVGNEFIQPSAIDVIAVNFNNVAQFGTPLQVEGGELVIVAVKSLKYSHVTHVKVLNQVVVALKCLDTAAINQIVDASDFIRRTIKITQINAIESKIAFNLVVAAIEIGQVFKIERIEILDFVVLALKAV